jgi:hypothetical protein
MSEPCFREWINMSNSDLKSSIAKTRKDLREAKSNKEDEGMIAVIWNVLDSLLYEQDCRVKESL